MTTVLQLSNRTLSDADILSRLANYQMMPKFLRESIIDQAIDSISYTEAELAIAHQQFYEQNQLTDTVRQDWLAWQQMSQEFLETIFIPRLLKIEKFKHQQWDHKLESYFLQRKSSLDQVIYSLIRVEDAEMAEELYFRIDANEQSFADVARQYSQGAEAQVNGLIGPVELGSIHPSLARLLEISQPGQLWQPMPIGKWIFIVRLETLIPAQLNPAMRQRLLEELFEIWIQEQMQQSLRN